MATGLSFARSEDAAGNRTVSLRTLCHLTNTGLVSFVEPKPAISRNVSGGTFEITKQLPKNYGEYECRIKSMNEPHERVARESELTDV